MSYPDEHNWRALYPGRLRYPDEYILEGSLPRSGDVSMSTSHTGRSVDIKS